MAEYKAETKLINLYAGPSSGKTTTAAGLFAWMKEKRMNVELAPEYAKDLVWDKSFPTLDDQIHILGEQHRRIYRLLGQVDYIICDSPILFSIIYGKDGLKKYGEYGPVQSSLNELAKTIYNQYDNYNYFVERGDREYIRAGRMQDLEGAKEKDAHIKTMLHMLSVPHKNIYSYKEILTDLGL
jgi:hypothetical protein